MSLETKAIRFQKMTDRFYGGKIVHGAERFLETAAGRVRVLCYGLEDARILPLFVNIHGGGFVIGHPEMDDPFMPLIVAEAERFRDKLSAVGVDVTHKRFEQSTHGFTLTNKPDAREGWRLMIEHLKKYV